MSKNQRAVHIYRFKGSGGPPEERSTESLNFKDFFELKHETVVLKESEMLSKDFCLVTANGRFIVDKREFKNEYITIAHHTGVSLYDSLFAVMLIQSQAIQIIHIKNNGKLIDLHRIGWFNHDDDELVLARYRDFNEQYIAQQTIKSTSPFYHHGYKLKEEDFGDPRALDRFESLVLAPTVSSISEFSTDATYHQVPSSSSANTGVPTRSTHFSQPYISQVSYSQSSHHDDQFANLVMWRMQFLDESTLLIKFGKLDCVVGRQADSTYQTAFFIFYDIITTEILAVYDNASEEFLRLYEAWADQFCATAYTTAGKTAQAVKRSLCVLPYSPQSLSDSPYLDQALFSYDEKVISASDRQRPCQDFPIKFYLRGSGELRFKIHLFKTGTIGGGANVSISNSNITTAAMNNLNNLNNNLNNNNNNSNNNTTTTNNNNINNNNNNNALNAMTGNIINNVGNIVNNNINGNISNVTTAGTGGLMSRSKRFATFIAHPFEPFIISVIQYHLQPTVLNLHLYRSDSQPL
ncbi:acid phosphatase det1 [Mortierella sp. AD011]|nr:acid phosphatase det1 [Mortierella sp. AD011]